MIGNPPWDRMRIEPVEWFASRRREIALAHRSADRKQMIEELRKSGDPLAIAFDDATCQVERGTRVIRTCGDYPQLGAGELNLYALFVERAMALAKPDGMVGLITPSGIASDKNAARFFKSVATEGRLVAFLDFENKRHGGALFFADVHAQFKFCVLVASPASVAETTKYAFFLHDLTELFDGNRCFPLSPDDFAKVNPNTGTAPIFRSRRDAELTTSVYSRLPVLVNHTLADAECVWPVKYVRMFDMSLASKLFRTRSELENDERAWPVGGNRYDSSSAHWVPLYEGKMIWHFDHRAASVLVNQENPHRPAYPAATQKEQHSDPNFTVTPQFWIGAQDQEELDRYALAFRDVTNPTDRRTFDACFIPHRYAGNTLPVLTESRGLCSELAPLCANFNAIVFDYICRQKVQKNHLNWYIVEQLPVVPPDRYEQVRFGSKSALEIVRQAVLELTYTAHDMAHFARDMGYVDEAGEVLPPYAWDEERRFQLLAKLDAVYFHLYGITHRDDIQYVFSTFPVISREQEREFGRYRSCDLCLAWTNALGAGCPDAQIEL